VGATGTQHPGIKFQHLTLVTGPPSGNSYERISGFLRIILMACYAISDGHG
jgi:hypothetical protein